MLTVVHVNAAQFEDAFTRECTQKYGVIGSIEQEYGYAINRAKLEQAARVLACPVKVNPPNWQHGRVIYAIARNYLSYQNDLFPVNMLDIGTAKGFSALCLLWALQDSKRVGTVTSIDVINPEARLRRNTVAEVDGPKTLHEILQPWPESKDVEFCCSTGVNWLSNSKGRIHFAFVDGKHNFASVSMEAELLAHRQASGDVAIFDDVQIPGVGEAVRKIRGYEVRWVKVNSLRQYAICTRH